MVWEVLKVVGAQAMLCALRQTSLNPDLKPTRTDQQQYNTKRPNFSALTSTKLPMHSINMPEWKDALHRYLVEKKHINS